VSCEQEHQKVKAGVGLTCCALTWSKARRDLIPQHKKKRCSSPNASQEFFYKAARVSCEKMTAMSTQGK
jgi:hypothetical protein